MAYLSKSSSSNHSFSGNGFGQAQRNKYSRKGGPPGFESVDPLKHMRIRANRASNLGPGKVRTNGTKFHAGHDLAAPRGTPTYAVMDAKVVAISKSKSTKGYGSFVTLAHYHPHENPALYKGATQPPRYYSFYAHLDSVNVKVGEFVKMGDQIGTVGTTGNATDHKDDNHSDIHLHFEFGTKLRSNGKYLSKDHLESPNRVYNTVKFASQDGKKKNQTFTGVIRMDEIYRDVYHDNLDGSTKWDGRVPKEF